MSNTDTATVFGDTLYLMVTYILPVHNHVFHLTVSLVTKCHSASI